MNAKPNLVHIGYTVYWQSKVNPLHFNHGELRSETHARAAASIGNKQHPTIDHWVEPAYREMTEDELKCP